MPGVLSREHTPGSASSNRTLWWRLPIRISYDGDACGKVDLQIERRAHSPFLHAPYACAKHQNDPSTRKNSRNHFRRRSQRQDRIVRSRRSAECRQTRSVTRMQSPRHCCRKCAVVWVCLLSRPWSPSLSGSVSPPGGRLTDSISHMPLYIDFSGNCTAANANIPSPHNRSCSMSSPIPIWGSLGPLHTTLSPPYGTCALILRSHQNDKLRKTSSSRHPYLTHQLGRDKPYLPRLLVPLISIWMRHQQAAQLPALESSGSPPSCDEWWTQPDMVSIPSPCSLSSFLLARAL
ncbi:hypothetical protein BD309DRAFT_701643 [Dichomitus squalens]|nr:hypothetical protein BD309DRAFT_701643 [Dichomitus squalens]